MMLFIFFVKKKRKIHSVSYEDYHYSLPTEFFLLNLHFTGLLRHQM